MKNIFPLPLVAALLFSFSARAQSGDTSHRWFMHPMAGAAQIQVTYRQADISDLNRALTADGLHAISPVNIWINASMQHTNGNLITENGIGFTPVAMSSNNGLYAKYNQYQLYLRAAYNIVHMPDIKLYPFAGINFSAGVLNIDDNAGLQTTGNLSRELINSTDTKTLYQPNFGIELGAGFDYSIPVKAKQIDCITIKRSIPVGLRAGYYINTFAGEWRIDDHTLAGGNQDQSTVFVSFNIGLGYEVVK